MEDLDVAFYLSMRTSAGFVDIPYQFYPLFGVDVMVVEIYYNFTDHTKQLNKYQLTPCDDED
jgi:hypothetical protein